MTPIIDVVFLLVIFLLISTTFKKKQLSMELNLPRAGKSEFRVSGFEHQIRVDGKGAMFLCPNEEVAGDIDALKCTSPADKKTLVAQFKKLKDDYPEIRLGVYAAADVNYEQVAKIVAAAIEAGLDLNLPYQTEEDAP